MMGGLLPRVPWRQGCSAFCGPACLPAACPAGWLLLPAKRQRPPPPFPQPLPPPPVRAQVIFRNIHKLLLDTATSEFFFCLDFFEDEAVFRDVCQPIIAIVEGDLAAATQVGQARCGRGEGRGGEGRRGEGIKEGGRGQRLPHCRPRWAAWQRRCTGACCRQAL
jgi:hypothetical protein